MKKCTLLGYGEVGKAIYEVFRRYHHLTYVDTKKGIKHKYEFNDFLLVAIPWSDKFIEEVKAFQKEHKPLHTIIFSTVPIGTCRKLDAVHSPIEGKHPFLQNSLKLAPRWFGGKDRESQEFLESIGFELKCSTMPEHTEFLKLRSTALYGINIEFARYSKKICDEINLPYKYCKFWDSDYNALYRQLGYPEYHRYSLDPPEGKIGGHCVVPNAEILDEQYPHEYLKQIYK